jgi:transmembrane sensor
MESSVSIRKRISAEAVDWLLEFQGPGSATADRQAFSEWLLRSPMHIEEYLALSTVWQGIQVSDKPEFSTESLIAAARTPDDQGNVVKLWSDDEREARNLSNELETRRTRRRWLGLAATLVLSAGIWLGYAQWHPASDFQTAVGEQRSITLADGSEVLLNTNSEVRVRWSRAERHIDLIRGEARFHVAKNPARPFIVETHEAAVRAVGTIFNVRADSTSTQVAVLEGRVKVTELASPVPAINHQQDDAASESESSPAAPASVELDAGQRAAVSGDRIELDKGPSTESVAAWTQKRLIFRDQQLGDVVNEFNRYRVSPFVIESPQLAVIRINGVFDLNDPFSLAAYLQDFESVHVTWANDGTVHLSRNNSLHK